jgi:hypothetical protein
VVVVGEWGVGKRKMVGRSNKRDSESRGLDSHRLSKEEQERRRGLSSGDGGHFYFHCTKLKQR